MTKSIEIKTTNLDETAPLYKQYNGQHNPQPAYIEIDPCGETIEVSADYSSIIESGCSADVFHNRVLQIACPAGVLGLSLIGFLESDEFKTEVQEICDGFELAWDGSNRVGRWNLDNSIEESIETQLRDLTHADIYTGDEWIVNDVEYYNESGESCDVTEAATATYAGIQITAENLKDLVDDAESCIDSYQAVTGIENAFESIIEALND